MLTTILGWAASSAVGSFIGGIAGNVIKKTDSKIYDKIAIGVGATIVANVLGDICIEHIEKRVAETKDAADKIIEMAKQKEDEANGGEVSE